MNFFKHKVTQALLLLAVSSQLLSCSQSVTVTEQKLADEKIVKQIQQPPSNVIIIVADQMRRASMNFWQQEKFKNKLNGRSDHVVTPHLDKIANQGAVFTQAIANYPLCSPFRGMLMSGLYPHNNGVTNNTRIDRPTVGLRDDITALTDVLSNVGYNTALVGKGHWKNNEPFFNDKNEYVGTSQAPGGHFFSGTKYDTFIPDGPARHSIEYWYQSIGHHHASPTVYTNDVKLTGQAEEKPYYPKTYSAVDQANVIIDYIKNNRQQRDVSKPFSLLWTMDPPHSPFKSLKDTDEDIYNEYYKDLPINTVLNRPNVDIERAQKFAKFHFSMVTLIDRELGRVMAELKRQGLDKNTLIVFTADHGEMMGSHGEMYKNLFYEESLSIPLLIQYPEKVKPQVTDLLINVPDFMPTILGLLSLDRHIPNNLDGIDYSQLLLNEQGYDDIELPKSSLYYGKNYEVGVRTLQYTFAINQAGELIALYDNVKDPYQLNLLSFADIPSKDAEMLKQELGYWLDKVKHPWYIDHKYPEMISFKKL